MAYVDDLKCMTKTVEDLKLQADKVSSFSDWAGMAVKPPKCGVSGILHRQASTGRFGGACTRDAVAHARTQLARVRLQGQALPFLHPDRDPYTYLGVPMTLSLNYSHYARALLRSVRADLEKLDHSFASPSQRLRTLRWVIIPKVTYAFPLMPLTLTDVDALDRLLVRCVKRAYRLPGYTPNAMIQRAQSMGGMGFTSLRVSYTQLNLFYLVKALNDRGPLGQATRSMMQHQLAMAGATSLAKMPAAARYLRLCRQHLLAESVGLQLYCGGTALAAAAEGLAAAHPRLTLAQLGDESKLPTQAFMPLYELGITSLAELCTGATGQYMLSTADLKRRYGSRARRRHLLALNQLTTILNLEPGTDSPPLEPCTRTDALPMPRRRIRHPIL
ncbi:MAG: hypothetical protein ACRC1H_08755, partial [Caldilineaceae bacterium]